MTTIYPCSLSSVLASWLFTSALLHPLTHVVLLWPKPRNQNTGALEGLWRPLGYFPHPRCPETPQALQGLNSIMLGSAPHSEG